MRTSQPCSSTAAPKKKIPPSPLGLLPAASAPHAGGKRRELRAKSTLELIKKNIEQFHKDIKTEIPKKNIAKNALKNSLRHYEALGKGCVFFYETDKVQIGLKGIDWSGAHRKHQEWPAQLNRFGWLPHLADVYKAKKDPQAPILARKTIEDWIDSHEPYAANKPLAKGDNTLNISIRLGQSTRPGWWNAAIHFYESEAFDEPFVRSMLDSTQCQIESLKAHISPKNNWRISHLDCILFCSLVLPGLEKHTDYAVAMLNEVFHRQVDPDGSHVEHCPSSYHQWMMRVFSSFVYLSRARPRLGLTIDPALVAKMWDYALYASTPDGGSSGLHDANVWRPTNRNHLKEQRKQYLRNCGLKGSEFNIEKQPCRFFPNAGHLFLRDSWRSNACYASMDAVRYGGGHTHLSKLAVNLFSGKRMLLCDPGIFTYESSDPFMAYGKSTAAHNTVTIRNYNQAETNPDFLEIQILKNFTVFCGAYAGSYFSGPMSWGFKNGLGKAEYGAHERVLLWIRGSYILIFDVVKADLMKTTPYQIHWQFPAGGARLDAKNNAAWTLGAEDNVYVRNVLASHPIKTAIHTGKKNPILGWLPLDNMKARIPAPHCVMTGSVKNGHSLSATLVMPFKGRNVPRLQVKNLANNRQHPQALELAFADGTRDFIVEAPTLHRMAGDCGPISTDGTLAFARVKNGKIAKAFLCSGSRLDFNGKPVIRKKEFGTYESG